MLVLLTAKYLIPILVAHCYHFPMERIFVEPSQDADETAWAERSAEWSNLPVGGKPRGRPLRHSNQPLILTGHGVRLRVDQGCLLVKSGFTYYPQAAEEHRFFPADRQKPARIIIIDGNGSISLDVLSWLTWPAPIWWSRVDVSS